jgi:hypothetical protein
MLDRTRKARPTSYALTAWNIEKREKGWFIYRTPFFSDPRATERGPYSSIMSACLMIARELAREAVKRHFKPTKEVSSK